MSTRSSNKLAAMLLKYLILLLLCLQNPTWCLGILQPEHSILERGLGTSFSTASELYRGSSNKVHMQVCITIGCCQHVCRQVSADVDPPSTPEPAATEFVKPAEDEQPDSEAAQGPLESSASAPSARLPLELQHGENLAIAPEYLEWNSQLLFSPSMKYLTIFNIGNDSWLQVLQVSSTDKQFYSQESDKSTIAPGESLVIPVVFLPQQHGVATGEIILQTSAGDLVIQAQGQGLSTPYQLPKLVGIEAVEGEKLKQRIDFHNPHNETIEIKEVQIWPGDSHKRALCLSAPDKTLQKISSCSADGWSKATLSNTRYEDCSSDEGPLFTLRRLGSWEIQPEGTTEIVELDMLVPETGTWSGSVYIKFSRSGSEEVLILPLELQIRSTCNNKAVEELEAVPEVQLGIRPRPGTDSPAGLDNLALNIQQALDFSGKWLQSDDYLALQIGKSLVRDLTAILLKQPEVKRGSLSAKQNEMTLFSGQMLSYPMVQTRMQEKLWINLVNPTDSPVSVKLILAPEVKSRDCKYKANWFCQAAQKEKLHKENGVFAFDTGAVTQMVIQARSKVAVGPLAFHPKERCDWSGLLFLKNNITGLEWMPLQGRGGSADLVVFDKDSVVQKLNVVAEVQANMSAEEACHRRVDRYFRVKNTGDMALQVHGLDLANAPGFTLGSTDGFTLAPEEMTELMISYEPDFQGAATKQALKLATSIGVIKVPVVATLPRELVALCRHAPLHEKVILPISVCALVLVLGVFSWLLFQELPTTRDVSKQNSTTKKMGKKGEWKITWKEIANFRSVRAIRRSCSPKITWRNITSFLSVRAIRGGCSPKISEGHAQEKPDLRVKIVEQEFPDKHKVKRKKKIRSSASPLSQGTSSGPCSPHSCSESEKVTAIEKFLNSSKFSQSRVSSRKSKSRISLTSKEVVVGCDIQAAWDRNDEAKLNIHPESKALEPDNCKAERDWVPVARKLSGNKEPHANKPQGAATSPRSSCPVWSVPSVEDNEVATSSLLATPAIAPSARAPGTKTTSQQDLSEGGIRSTPTTNKELLTSIGRLRREAVERTKEKRPEQNLGEVLYDIWGDHFAEISNAFTAPSNVDHLVGTQSLFSQSLPTRTQHVSSYGSIPPSPIASSSTNMTSDGFLLPSSDLANAFMTSINFFHPGGIETYTGIHEPVFDCCTESFYRALIS